MNIFVVGAVVVAWRQEQELPVGGKRRGAEHPVVRGYFFCYI
jgi:hypothetical protein